MEWQRKINFLNPIRRLGKRQYSSVYPVLGSFIVFAFIELIIKLFALSAADSSGIIIAVSIGTIIYFSFHSGIRGGILSTVITILYYFYIIKSRNYTGAQYHSGVDTTILLGVLYFIIGALIGWLKETIDKLIEKEADGRIRLQTIIAQLPVGIIVADENGKISQQNKRLEEILGYKIPKDFIAGKTEPGNNVDPRQTPLAQALGSGKITKGKQYEIKKRGKSAYVLVNAAPVRNKNGKVIAGVTVIDDITREKQLENRKDDFINIASHELKTPITSMKLYLDFLARKFENKKNSDDLSTIKSVQYQTEKLQALVSNLLDVTKINNAKMRFTQEKFRLDSLVENTINELRPTTNGHKIKLEKDYVNVYADKFRIYQVLTNLITNAVKFSPNSKEIVVKVGRVDGVAKVSVQDFGIGIAKAEQNKIFERLYQVNDDEKKTFPGFGMGLYISKQIIKRHRGKIWAESDKGKGSTFYFNLPALDE